LSHAKKDDTTEGMSLPPDPRLSPNFDPTYLPLCEGFLPPEPETEHPIEQRMLEFVAAYYRLNECYDRLRLARLGSSQESPAHILEDIDKAVHARDALEDRLSPEGFYAEAIVEGVLTVDLVFSHALKKHVSPAQVVQSSFSLYVPMPPPGVDIDDYLRQHLSGLFGIEPPAPKKKSTPNRKLAAPKASAAGTKKAPRPSAKTSAKKRKK
jgi:hypothetical protein